MVLRRIGMGTLLGLVAVLAGCPQPEYGDSADAANVDGSSGLDGSAVLDGSVAVDGSVDAGIEHCVLTASGTRFGVCAGKFIVTPGAPQKQQGTDILVVPAARGARFALGAAIVRATP